MKVSQHDRASLVRKALLPAGTNSGSPFPAGEGEKLIQKKVAKESHLGDINSNQRRTLHLLRGGLLGSLLSTTLLSLLSLVRLFRGELCGFGGFLGGVLGLALVIGGGLSAIGQRLGGSVALDGGFGGVLGGHD